MPQPRIFSARSCLVLLLILTPGWLWFFFSIAEDLARPADLCGALLFWPLLPGFHLLAHVPQVPGIMHLAFFLVPSLFLIAYYLPALIASRGLISRPGRTIRHWAAMTLLIGAYVAASVAAYRFFDGFPS